MVLSGTLTYFHFVPHNTAQSGEWQTYMDIATYQEVHKDIIAFWRAVECCLQQLAAVARSYIAFSVSSVDVEQSFS